MNLIFHLQLPTDRLQKHNPSLQPSLWLVQLPAVLCHQHSVITLLARPAHQLVNANIKSASHVADTKCIEACRHDQEVQLFFRPNVRKGNKCDLSDYGQSDQTGWFENIIKCWSPRIFFHTIVSRICREWCKKHPVSTSSVLHTQNLIWQP